MGFEVNFKKYISNSVKLESQGFSFSLQIRKGTCFEAKYHSYHNSYSKKSKFIFHFQKFTLFQNRPCAFDTYREILAYLD